MELASFYGEGSQRRIRSCPWERLPLGSVILGWPEIHNATIPELAAYPLVTERLRAELFRKYQFLAGRSVVIADPSLGLDEARLSRARLDARRFLDGKGAATALKQELRSRFLGHAEVREGLASCGRYDGAPYALVKDWMRSVSAMVRDSSGFGTGIWDEGEPGEDLGAVLGRLLAGAVPRLPDARSSSVDIAIDVSFSMKASGKAALAWSTLAGIVGPLAHRLGTSTWRLWLIADKARQIEWSLHDPDEPGAIDRLMSATRLSADETRFCPFLEEMLKTAPGPEHRLVIVVTDGDCQDQGASLRALEKLGTEGIDYLQLVLHADAEYRSSVESGKGKDGVVLENELGEGEKVRLRSDSELADYCAGRLRSVTDLAEAARGGQLVLTWYPLFGALALDVYERYLGQVIMAAPPVRPGSSTS